VLIVELSARCWVLDADRTRAAGHEAPVRPAHDTVPYGSSSDPEPICIYGLWTAGLGVRETVPAVDRPAQPVAGLAGWNLVVFLPRARRGRLNRGRARIGRRSGPLAYPVLGDECGSLGSSLEVSFERIDDT